MEHALLEVSGLNMLKIAWDPIYVHPLPEQHRFPMIKYELIAGQLLYEGTITEENLFTPSFQHDEKLITHTHHPSYWNKLKTCSLSPGEIRRTGFPLSKLLVDREVVIMNGTVEATRYAFAHGIAMNIAGGTHHAYSDRGEGFCLLNDQAVAANFLKEHHLAQRILIVDLDVHQGNGTAEIFQHDEQVFTFSMHGAKNYPMHKEKSDVDIGLPDGIEDGEYLKILQYHLSAIMDSFEPDFVFYQSGVDVLATDKLGRLALSMAGCKERDRAVLQLCKQNRIPLVVSMGGGYSEKIHHIVEAHANTFRLAQELFF
jgi:acetoin utilization deacetylase AcuC-like enzyme